MTYRTGKKQTCAGARRRAALAVALVSLSLALSCCGKKAGQLDPPPDVTEDHFPYTYPDPATDPKP